MKENVDRETQGKLDSAKGFASESRLMAALLERGFNASQAILPHSTYDLVVEVSTYDLIRVQVKTVDPNNRVKFMGGLRGGADKFFKSDVKVYTQDTEKSDIVVGVESIRVNGDREINFYFIPTLLIEILGQKSLSINKIPQAKNDWEILVQCKDVDFVTAKFYDLMPKPMIL